jgi:hypothetical protein
MLRLLSPLYLLSFTLLAVGLAVGLEAKAQHADQGRYMRVTTGATQFRDWEKPLVQGNPNLSHFTWCPVTGYIQGRQKVIQRRGPDGQIVQVVPGSKRRNIYMKPIHVSPNYIANRPANPDVHGAVRVPTIIPAKPKSPAQEASLRGAIHVPTVTTANEDLLGKLHRQRAAEAVAARLQAPRIATYPALSGTIYPRQSSSDLQGQCVDKQVHGLLKAAFPNR